MRKNLIRSARGFVLIELIIAIVILGALSAVAVPQVTGYVEKSRTAADLANTRILNTVTRAYLAVQPSASPFEIEGTADAALLEALVDAGYLGEIPETKWKDAAFVWDFDSQTWILTVHGKPIETGRTVVTVTADTVTIVTGGGFKGYIKDSYTGSAKDIAIPASVDGTAITSIYQDVFSGKGLTSVTFPSDGSLGRIHARAFKNNALTEVTLPSSITRLDYGAFMDNDIVKVTIGPGVKLEGNVFRNNDAFRDAYNVGGAGTYLFLGGVWVKQ